ncbi:RC-LH1 core complex protein PufX [Paracoccaceae bacterium Fryx2]|nr:RC-LH1 core complex protein PufX [Paracoccaceae bacterium Fryx2]
MAEKYEFVHGKSTTIRGFVLGNMLKGAGWAALLVFGWLAFIYLLIVMSWLLPTDPNAAQEAGQSLLTAFV